VETPFTLTESVCNAVRLAGAEDRARVKGTQSEVEEPEEGVGDDERACKVWALDTS
jgi:hypothetical protein